jgi:hypothetical protein
MQGPKQAPVSHALCLDIGWVKEEKSYTKWYKSTSGIPLDDRMPLETLYELSGLRALDSCRLRGNLLSSLLVLQQCDSLALHRLDFQSL